MTKASKEKNSIVINIRWQTLTLTSSRIKTKFAGKAIKRYSIATAKNGFGQLEGSECTPLGKHVIAEKIGANQAENTVFVGRVPTGEIYSEAFAKTQKQRDWILSRILWLQGLEEGVNKGQDTSGVSCDTMQRYIYIHGCPDSHAMQIPSSHGCIKMRNTDMIELFELCELGDSVLIKPE